MNKALVGALVGGLILFIWQFLSWTILPVHSSEMAYTDKQDEILVCLAASGIEDGTYFLPNLAPGYTSEEYKAYQENMEGNPWALIRYRTEAHTNMPLNMIRALVVDVLAVFFLCYILTGIPDLSFQKAIISSVMVGLIGFFTISYLDSIWFESNAVSYLLDSLVQWILVGSWLGWWLTRK